MDDPQPKTVSLAKLAANRQNAQKSTGPRSKRGMEVAKMNAVKHGVLARELLIRGKNARESEREFRALQARFREHLAPVGPLEEMLVDQIVSANWRLRRVLKAEAGEIAKNVDSGHWKRTRHDPLFASMQWNLLGDPATTMSNSSLGNSLMESELKAVRASVEKDGELTEAAIQTVIFHGKPYSLTEELHKLRSDLQANPEGLESTALREKQKAQALAWLDRKIRLVSWNKEDCLEHERNAEEAQQAAALLPEPEALNKIMRYETKLERQLYRAMNQLERLQRLRQGDAVPPPLTMEVNDRL